MATQYEIDITMTADTITGLQQGGFSLYGFKAVQTSNASAAPTVWFQSKSFLQTTQVIWQEQYQAYVSDSQIIPNGVIQANTAIDINLDETANVDQYGNLTITETGIASAISIYNTANVQWTAGISEVVNNVANPMCALPLYGTMLDVIAPIEKVLLMFATNTVNTGTVIYQSFSSGVLVDLTSAQQRTVNFDLNGGWTWGGAGWGTPVKANDQLVPFLITSSSSAASMVAPKLLGLRPHHGGRKPPQAEQVTVQIRAGQTQVFPNGTVNGNMELDNRHNVQGNVSYQIGAAPAVNVPMVANQEYQINGVNGQQLTVTNNLPNSLYCVY